MERLWRRICSDPAALAPLESADEGEELCDDGHSLLARFKSLVTLGAHSNNAEAVVIVAARRTQ